MNSCQSCFLFCFLLKIKSSIYKTCFIIFQHKFVFIAKKSYPCGLIIYCTTIVYKLTQLKKSWKCLTKTPPELEIKDNHVTLNDTEFTLNPILFNIVISFWRHFWFLGFLKLLEGLEAVLYAFKALYFIYIVSYSKVLPHSGWSTINIV